MPPDPVIHRAGWVVADPKTIIRDGWVRTGGGRVVEVGSGPLRKPSVDHGPGILMPATVNAHTHLELSGLKGRVRTDAGFGAWVADLIEQRDRIGPDGLRQAAMDGIESLTTAGCAAVGDVSTLGLTRDLLLQSGLGGVWFREYLGNGPSPDDSLEDELRGPAGPLGYSLAGHGPHTTSPALLRALKATTRRAGTIFSIHLDESDDERELITTGRGAWAEFLRSRGIDPGDWGLPAPSPTAHLSRIGVLDDRTLAVHLIGASAADLETLARHRVRVCVCPRSNRTLHGRRPELPAILDAGLTPCLGTDSLASAETLDPADEMAEAARAYPSVAPETIFAMATVNGAKALGIDRDVGTLAPGGRAVFAEVPVSPARRSEVLPAVVHQLTGLRFE